MNNLDFNFEEVEPEYQDALAATPQMVVLSLGLNTVKVIVYFMLNNGLHITGGKVLSGMGVVTLTCKAESPSGCVTASNRLRKIIYTFTNAQGMAREFEFKCQIK